MKIIHILINIISQIIDVCDILFSKSNIQFNINEALANQKAEQQLHIFFERDFHEDTHIINDIT